MLYMIYSLHKSCKIKHIDFHLFFVRLLTTKNSNMFIFLYWNERRRISSFFHLIPCIKQINQQGIIIRHIKKLIQGCFPPKMTIRRKVNNLDVCSIIIICILAYILKTFKHHFDSNKNDEQMLSLYNTEILSFNFLPFFVSFTACDRFKP